MEDNMTLESAPGRHIDEELYRKGGGMATAEALQQKYTVNEILPDGIGYGEGSIGRDVYYDKLAAHQECDIDTAVVDEIGKEVIKSGECMVPINVDDDGCGDGRRAVQVFQKVADKLKYFSRSEHRAKIFGAGPMVAREMSVSVFGYVAGSTFGTHLREAVGRIKAFNEKRKNGEKTIDMGAHTASHVHGDGCGCGAIDLSPLIIKNAVKNYEKAHGLIRALMGQEAADSVGTSYKAVTEQRAADEAYSEGYSGTDTIEYLLDEGSVVKELDGTHNEVFVVVNTVRGMTFDQQAFTDRVRSTAAKKLMARALQPGGRFEGATPEEVFASDYEAKLVAAIEPQVFVIDAWRLEDYAHVFAKAYCEEEKNDKLYDDAYNKALYAAWAFQLATADTLTNGTLPVFMVKAD